MSTDHIARPLIACVLLGVAATLSGCSSGSDSAPTSTISESSSAIPSSSRSSSKSSSTSSEDERVVPTSVVVLSTVEVIELDDQDLMPDVLCMDLQDAQNLIQDNGVFFSRSEDASGQGRRQIIDRNWIVVAQEPAAGTPIGEGDAMLSVLKDDEVTDCG